MMLRKKHQYNPFIALPPRPNNMDKVLGQTEFFAIDKATTL